MLILEVINAWHNLITASWDRGFECEILNATGSSKIELYYLRDPPLSSKCPGMHLCF